MRLNGSLISWNHSPKENGFSLSNYTIAPYAEIAHPQFSLFGGLRLINTRRIAPAKATAKLAHWPELNGPK